MNYNITNLNKDVFNLIIDKLSLQDLANLGASCSGLKSKTREAIAKLAFATIEKKVNENSCGWTDEALKQISPKEITVSENYLRVILPYLKKLSEFNAPYHPLLNILKELSINVETLGPCFCQLD